MDTLIITKLRENALILRRMASSESSRSEISKTKTKMMEEIHLILVIMLGPPPKTTEKFTWDFYDKDEKLHTLTAHTPLTFAAELSSPSAVAANSGTDVNVLFSLVNDPRHPYGSHLTVDKLGNVAGGRGITYANVAMQTMKRACIATLRAGIPIFFGCDVGQDSSTKLGIMDTGLFDYEIGFNVKLGMNKEERLRAGASAMTHAMVLTGVHVLGEGAEERSVRWRVENSWGESAGSKGYFVMSDEWMDEWTYQVVVDPRYACILFSSFFLSLSLSLYLALAPAPDFQLPIQSAR
jgi:bleomycin hydrolase